MYHWIGYPDPDREVAIVTVQAPEVSEVLARKVVAAVNRLREMDLAKPPGVAETIDWARTLSFLGETGLSVSTADVTLGSIIKDRDDLELVRDNLREVTSHV
jgi:MoxR-like ATPase